MNKTPLPANPALMVKRMFSENAASEAYFRILEKYFPEFDIFVNRTESGDEYELKWEHFGRFFIGESYDIDQFTHRMVIDTLVENHDKVETMISLYDL